MTTKNQRNPILPPDIHVPDSEAHVMPDGQLYLYGSFDHRNDVFCSEEYHVVSTPDLKTWTVHDTSLTGAQIPWFDNPEAPHYPGIDWSHPTPFILKMMARDEAAGIDRKAEFEKAAQQKKPPLLFAPDCTCKDGKYYLYFCMSDDSEGVAVSDYPEGPFLEPKQLPCGGIDPAIFIDDDGQAYYYWGQLSSHGVKLDPDMISFDQNNITDNLVTEEQHFFHEGSSMRRIGDTYYYVYADMERGKPTALGYATAKSPLGPFTYRGIIIDNAACDPSSWNNHGSIECVNGQWYVFYHRCSGGTQQNRRLCIEKIEIMPDGTIPEVKMTSQGIGKPYQKNEWLEGWRACEVYGGAFIGPSADSRTECLLNLKKGSAACWRYLENDGSICKAVIYGKGSGTAEVFLNRNHAGTLRMQDGAGECAITLKDGMYTVEIEVLESDGMEIDGIQFS